MNEISDSAVTTRKLCFLYKNCLNKKPVLNCIDMIVPQEVIYGLLGPSGCGKTSLLKAIVGFIEPDAGVVFVFGRKQGRSNSDIPGVGVGYMPQEIGLQEYLKIKEIFQYFGKIYFQSNSMIEEKMRYFLNLLNLSDENATIQILSAGQKRRLSLAIDVFTEPLVLILDEPTVGVDPLLRNLIWQFLKQITTEKRITVIVTTHYIEEMKYAQKVAFMRDGEILVENTPSIVIAQYHRSTLEDVFYDLSYIQSRRRNCVLTRKDIAKMSQEIAVYDSVTLINDPLQSCSQRTFRYLRY